MGEFIKSFLNLLSVEPTFTEKVNELFQASVKIDKEKSPEGLEAEGDGSINLLTIINNLLVKAGEPKIVLNRQVISRFQ